MPNMKIWWYTFGIFVWVLFLYAPTVWHPFVMWDDPIYIFLNPLVTNWGDAPWSARLLTERLLYPVPLPVALYALGHQLFGELSVWFIHGLSVSIHALNAVLVFLFCRRIGASEQGAGLAAVLWASHPVMVESVAWATNLKEVLMTAAILGVMVVAQSEKKWWLIFPILGVGFASKPTFAVVGALLFLVFWHQRASLKQLAGAGMLALFGAAYAAWTASLHHSELQAGFEQRNFWVTIGKALGVQLRNATYPLNLQPYYPLNLQHWDGIGVLGMVALTMMVFAGLYFFRTKNTLAFGIAFMAMAWLPYSNLLPLPRFTADTYAYLPGVGFALSTSILLSKLSRLQSVLGLAITIIFGVLTLEQGARWVSTEALWSPMLGQPEVLALPYSLIGFEAHLLGENERAADLLLQAWPYLVSQSGEPGYARNVFEATGRWPENYVR